MAMCISKAYWISCNVKQNTQTGCCCHHFRVLNSCAASFFFIIFVPMAHPEVRWERTETNNSKENHRTKTFLSGAEWKRNSKRSNSERIKNMNLFTIENWRHFQFYELVFLVEIFRNVKPTERRTTFTISKVLNRICNWYDICHAYFISNAGCSDWQSNLSAMDHRKTNPNCQWSKSKMSIQFHFPFQVFSHQKFRFGFIQTSIWNQSFYFAMYCQSVGRSSCWCTTMPRRSSMIACVCQ